MMPKYAVREQQAIEVRMITDVAGEQSALVSPTNIVQMVDDVGAGVGDS